MPTGSTRRPAWWARLRRAEGSGLVLRLRGSARHGGGSSTCLRGLRPSCRVNGLAVLDAGLSLPGSSRFVARVAGAVAAGGRRAGRLAQQEVARHFLDDARANGLHIRREPREHRVLTGDADGPGNAPRHLVDQHDGALRQYSERIAAAGLTEPAGDVRRHLPDAERRQVGPQRDSLLQMAQLGTVEHVGEFGLPGHHDREQRLGERLEVGQQPDFLHQLRRQALLLVDHEGREVLRLVPLHQQPLELDEELGGSLPDGAGYPSSFEAGGFVSRKMLRSALLRASSRGRIPKWSISIRSNTGHSIVDPGRLDGFVNIPVPRGRLEMSDPFLLDHGGRAWMLFEDVPLGGRRGRLACMEMSERGACSDVIMLMDREDHLSYLCVVPHKGDVFLVPENAEAGLVNLYRFAPFPSRFELESTLCDGFPVVDTTPVFVEDRWYVFATTTPPFMETLLSSSSGLDKPWTRHPASPVSRSARSCRSAGHLFRKEGRLFRPTQDCSVRYGYAMTVNEITRLTATEFEEHAVAHFLPTWAPGLLGTHTWNETARLQVIDGLRY